MLSAALKRAASKESGASTTPSSPLPSSAHHLPLYAFARGSRAESTSPQRAQRSAASSWEESVLFGQAASTPPTAATGSWERSAPFRFRVSGRFAPDAADSECASLCGSLEEGNACGECSAVTAPEAGLASPSRMDVLGQPDDPSFVRSFSAEQFEGSSSLLVAPFARSLSRPIAQPSRSRSHEWHTRPELETASFVPPHQVSSTQPADHTAFPGYIPDSLRVRGTRAAAKRAGVLLRTGYYEGFTEPLRVVATASAQFTGK